MDEPIVIAIDDIAEIETLVAVHGAARSLDSSGHVCFALAVAVATSGSG